MSLLFNNLYLSEPLQAETDLVETNFGFQMAAPSQQQENLSDSDGLGKVETLKESLLKNKTRIFSLEEFDPLVDDQFASFLSMLPMLLMQADVNGKVILYDMCTTLIRLSQPGISNFFNTCEELPQMIVDDITQYRHQTIMLLKLGKLLVAAGQSSELS